MSYSKQNFRSGDTLYASQLNAMDDEIAVLEAEVESTKNMVGSPLTASTTAGMSDQTKIYVYTGSETGYTAGHWYYYNGTAWTDGGVYNSVAVNTDTSLTVSGQAADGKAVGDELSDLKSDLNQKYEKPSTGIPASDLATGVIPEVPVQDVQVNGTSVLGQDGVANIPKASSTDFGAVKVRFGTDGLRSNDGILEIYPPSDAVIKSGDDNYKPLTTYKQHMSTFYGLAKAAGDSTQSSSSNAVGSYTDDAKIKIQKMLGIYEAPWELIRADLVTNATKEDIEIVVDSNGQPFELTDIRLMVSLPEQETEAKVEDYGRVRCYYSGSNNDVLYIGTTTVSAGASGKGAQAWIEQHDGMIERCFTKFASEGSYCQTYSNNSFRQGISSHWQLATQSYNKVKICAVTGKCQYYLFGKRKW